MQIFFEKSCTIVLLTFETVGNNIFLAVGHRTLPIAFKSLLKYVQLQWEINQNYFDYPSKHSLVKENRLVWRKCPFAKLRSAPGGKMNIPTCFRF